jgi:hypothetical protein
VKRDWSQQNSTNYAKDCGAGADSKRKCDHNHGRKARLLHDGS